MHSASAALIRGRGGRKEGKGGGEKEKKGGKYIIFYSVCQKFPGAAPPSPPPLTGGRPPRPPTGPSAQIRIVSKRPFGPFWSSIYRGAWAINNIWMRAHLKFYRLIQRNQTSEKRLSSTFSGQRKPLKGCQGPPSRPSYSERLRLCTHLIQYATLLPLKGLKAAPQRFCKSRAIIVVWCRGW